jgi:hyperosmotically inducible periplasmic protein
MKITVSTLVAILALSGGTAALNSGCAATPTRQSTGEYLDDAGITTKVKAAFVRDPLVKALDVGVDTFKAVVQLNGFVDTEEQRARAEQIAAGIGGVAAVQNNITVKTAAATP